MLMTLSEYASKYGHGKLLDIGCGDKPYRGLFSSRVSQFIGLDTNKIPTKADVYGSVINIPFKEKSVEIPARLGEELVTFIRKIKK